jgi:hypothetical protein
VQKGVCVFCAGEEHETNLLFKLIKTERLREGLLNNKSPDSNVEIALGETTPGSNVTEKRSLGTVACKIKCKWENQMKKRDPR